MPKVEEERNKVKPSANITLVKPVFKIFRPSKGEKQKKIPDYSEVSMKEPNNLLKKTTPSINSVKNKKIFTIFKK